MYKYSITVYLVICFLSSGAQTLDSLKLGKAEIPAGYSLTEHNNCISVQACSLYDGPEIFESLFGKLKSKQAQHFNSKKDNGSILYFEFENEFKQAAFLGGLLWGGKKPSSEHPEEFYSKGKFLVIWSFKKGSPITKISRDKIVKLLTLYYTGTNTIGK